MKNFDILPRNPYFENTVIQFPTEFKVGMICEVDMTECAALRASYKAEGKAPPSINALLVLAIARALRKHPYANRMCVNLPLYKRLVQFGQCDISVAVDRSAPGREQAAYAATIRQADARTLDEITEELRVLASETSSERWKQYAFIVEKLPPRLAQFLINLSTYIPSMWVQHRGGAVLISSPAKFGVDIMVGTWPWPLGFSFGIVRQRPIAKGNEVIVRPVMHLSMSFDRRIMAGAPAAQFFNTVCTLLGSAQSSLAGSAE